MNWQGPCQICNRTGPLNDESHCSHCARISPSARAQVVLSRTLYSATFWTLAVLILTWLFLKDR
jgi:hypothetical protein